MDDLSREINDVQQYALNSIAVVKSALSQMGIEDENILYRVKSEQSIREKIELWKQRTPYITEQELLHSIGDIAALTVVTDSIDDATSLLPLINERMNRLGLHNSRVVLHLNDNTPTKYNGVLSFYQAGDTVRFEIQITDNKNLEIRESTHDEFRVIKYRSVRETTDEIQGKALHLKACGYNL